MQLYMSDFEHHMQDLEIPRERWVTSLRPLLSNWARQTVDLLGEESRRDYQKVSWRRTVMRRAPWDTDSSSPRGRKDKTRHSI